MDLRPVVESLLILPTYYVGPEIGEPYRQFIASSPLWLAQVVVGWVEERTLQYQCLRHYIRPLIKTDCWDCEEATKTALHDFNLTPDLWQRLKARIKEAKG